MTGFPRARREAGQALVELVFFIVIMMFVVIGAYEASVLYHNTNAVNNALKQAALIAAMGGSNEEIRATIANADKQMHYTGFLMHSVSNYSLVVGVPIPNGSIRLIAPNGATTKDPGFTGGSPTEAAYIYRAQDYNIRVGLEYRIAYSAPLAGAVYLLPTNALWLSASQPIIARNDDDRDGLVDLYEPELFVTNLGADTWVGLSHLDNGTMDVDATNIDGDTIINESGLDNYDFDNDGIQDKFDPDQNRLRHPVIGGNKVTVLQAT